MQNMPMPVKVSLKNCQSVKNEFQNTSRGCEIFDSHCISCHNTPIKKIQHHVAPATITTTTTITTTLSNISVMT